MPKQKSKSKTKPKTESKKPSKVSLTKKRLEELLVHLKVEAKIEVKKGEEEAIEVQLTSDDPGALIGYHGETLSSLQLILGMILYRQTGEWTRVLVNVNDYREKRQENLERMALSAAQRVRFSAEAQALPPMSAAERRLVHLALANDEEIVTESEGEDRQRRVVIRPKSG